MILEIDIRDEEFNLTYEMRGRLEEALSLVFEMEGITGDPVVSMSFVDGEEIRRLNKDFRNIDRETDVLSFPLIEKEDIENLKEGQYDKSGPLMLGDIVVNYDRVRSQAKEYGHSEEREAIYLCIHSLLHLLGYDHIEEGDKKLMRSREKESIKKLGLSAEMPEDMPDEREFHSGYVGLIGRPNVGKSSLLNALMEEKLSIVSDKAQTTRNEILYIYNRDHMQAIILDTPGVQTPKNELGKEMLKLSRDSLSGLDLCLYITDVGDKPGRLDSMVLDMLKEKDGLKKVCLLNKLDLADQISVDANMKLYEDMGIFEEVLAISAKTGQGLDQLNEVIYGLLPKGPMYYPDDMITDRSERFIVSEIIRGACLNNLREEVPHGIAVIIEKMHEREDKDLIDIDACIVVERDSHKGIVIGKGGKTLKIIASAARKDIESFLMTKVNLKTWVKVDKNWRKRKKRIEALGYGDRD